MGAVTVFLILDHLTQHKVREEVPLVWLCQLGPEVVIDGDHLLAVQVIPLENASPGHKVNALPPDVLGH